MPIKIQDLEMRAKMPDVPRTMEVHELAAPSLAERKTAIDLFSRRLELGDLKRAELPYGPVFGGPRGEVHFFAASGGLFIRNAAISAQFKTEERPWAEIEKITDGRETRYGLGVKTAEKLRSDAVSMLRDGGLASEQMGPATLVLDQWAQLDGKGKVLRAGGGTATVKCTYSVDGIPVAGAGAKTLVYAEPSGTGAAISGLFHAWRPTGARTKVEVGSLESALAAGLLNDPELVMLYQRGQRVAITRLNLCYLALPAFEPQRHLFPVFQVEAVTKTKRGFEARFGKFVHAVAARQYAQAGIFAHYLQGVAEDSAASTAG